MEVIRIVDTAMPWLRWVLEAHPDWERKALKSTANYARDQIKAGIKSGAPGGSTYAPRISDGRRRDIPAARRGGSGRRKKWSGTLGALSNAVRYRYDGKNSVEIGWLASWAELFGLRMERGATEPVSKKMRGLWGRGAEGLKKDTTSIVIPRRPTFAPMYSYLQPRIGEYFRNKILFYVENGGPPGKYSGKG